MKSILTLLIGVLLFSCGNSEEKVKQTEAINQQPKTSPPVPGDAIENEEYNHEKEFIFDTIRASKAGIIDWTSGKKKVKKGQTLYGYENSEAFHSLDLKKKKLHSHMDSLVKTAVGDLSFVKQKWQSFTSSLRSDTLLPHFPKIQYKEEGMYFGNETIAKEYNEIATIEGNMKSNFVTARASYARVIWKIKPGKKVKKGEIIAIGQRSDLFIINVH